MLDESLFHAGEPSAGPVTIVAALGPNPAPLTELMWALQRRYRLTIGELYVVVDQHGHLYLEEEVLQPGRALEELDALLGVPRRPDSLHLRVVQGPRGVALDDEDPAHAEIYNTAIWETARAATQAAGAHPVVFGLTAGRRRTMTAMSTMAFQLLARRQDICVDVRLTDRRAEGGSGFFFPEQQEQHLRSRAGEPFLAREVEVQLVNVRLPRLRGLLAEEELATYASALAAGQRAIDALSPPRLVVDLTKGEARADGLPLPLSHSELIWYASLAHARHAGDGWVAADDTSHLDVVTSACARFAWSDAVKSVPLRARLGEPELYTGDEELTQDLAKLRADTRKRLQAWCKEHRPAASPFLTPESRRWKVDGVLAFFQRLPLAPERIQLIGLAGS